MPSRSTVFTPIAAESSRSIDVNPCAAHCMAVRESVIRAMRKARSLLCLGDGNVLPGQSFKFSAKIKDVLHRKGNIARLCRTDRSTATLSAQEVKPHTAHVSKIICHLYDAGEFPNIFRRNNAGQTDLNAALCETLNPCNHSRRCPATIPKTSERIAHRGSAVKADTDTE